jgi:hypothetical protein
MSQACELVKSKLRHLEGAVTENGLIQFLSNGYICKMIDDCPGGFTFFMVRPHYITGGTGMGGPQFALGRQTGFGACGITWSAVSR